MATAVTQNQVLEILAAMKPAADAQEINGRASYLLAEELLALGKPVEAITLGEIRAAYDRMSVRYDDLMKLCYGK